MAHRLFAAISLLSLPDAQTYRESTSITSFKDQLVQCSSSTCTIICDTDHGCNALSINASKSDLLELYCSSSSSCTELNIVDGPSQNLTVSCEGSNSCDSMILNSPYTWRIDITCAGFASCSSADFHVAFAASVDVSLQCNAEELACDGLTFYCAEDEAYSTGLRYSRLDASCVCENERCCPGNMRRNTTTVYCASDECQMTCLNGRCPVKSILDASNASSLLLECSTDAECEHLSVICPEHGVCDIRCTAPFACQYIDISASNASSLSILCEADYSCQYLQIDAAVVDSADISCLAASTCQHASITMVGLTKRSDFSIIAAHNQTLLSSALDVQGVNQFTIHCLALSTDSLCQHMRITAIDSNRVAGVCDGPNCFDFAVWNLSVQDFDLACHGYNEASGCNAMAIDTAFEHSVSLQSVAANGSPSSFEDTSLALSCSTDIHQHHCVHADRDTVTFTCAEQCSYCGSSAFELRTTRTQNIFACPTMDPTSDPTFEPTTEPSEPTDLVLATPRPTSVLVAETEYVTTTVEPIANEDGGVTSGSCDRSLTSRALDIGMGVVFGVAISWLCMCCYLVAGTVKRNRRASRLRAYTPPKQAQPQQQQLKPVPAPKKNEQRRLVQEHGDGNEKAQHILPVAHDASEEDSKEEQSELGPIPELPSMTSRAPNENFSREFSREFVSEIRRHPSKTTFDSTQLADIDREKHETKQIRKWLKNTVEVPRGLLDDYLKCFLSSGFETLDYIREIESDAQLKEIGIGSADHQMRLMMHIQHLNQFGDDKRGDLILEAKGEESDDETVVPAKPALPLPRVKSDHLKQAKSQGSIFSQSGQSEGGRRGRVPPVPPKLKKKLTVTSASTRTQEESSSSSSEDGGTTTGTPQLSPTSSANVSLQRYKSDNGVIGQHETFGGPQKIRRAHRNKSARLSKNWAPSTFAKSPSNDVLYAHPHETEEDDDDLKQDEVRIVHIPLKPRMNDNAHSKEFEAIAPLDIEMMETMQ